MGVRSFSSFIILFFLIITESKAISLMGIISDKYLSDCKDSGINSARYNQSISNSLKCTARVDNLSVYTGVIQKSEDQLFNVMAEQQRELVQCHKKNIDTLNRNLRSDVRQQNIFLEKTRYNLIQLQELAYKRSRLKNSLENQQRRNSRNRPQPANKAKDLPEDFTKALIAKLDDEIAVLKTSFTHYNAKGLQKIINDSIQSATDLGQEHSRQFSYQSDKLNFLEDVVLEARLFNQFHKKTSADIPNINKLTEIYDDYAKSFQETDDKLGRSAKLVNGEWQYKLSDDLKRELFLGPSGEKFILNNSQNASSESKDMICKLDARYGKERNKNAALVDGVMGVGLLGLTVAEFFTPAAPAAPVTAAAGMTRVMSVVNVIKNANVVKVAEAGLSTAALFSSAADVATKCQSSLSQVSSCTEQTAQVQMGKLNLSECVMASVSTLGGAGTLGITFLRNTKLGRSTAEQFGKFRFHDIKLKQRADELGVLPKPQGSIDVRTVGLEEAMANATAHGAHLSTSVNAGTTILKYGQENPKILEAAKSFWVDGSVLKLNALDPTTRLKAAEFMEQMSKTTKVRSEVLLSKTADPVEMSKLRAEIASWRQRYEVSKKFKGQVYAEVMATELTVPAKKTLDAVSKIETATKTGISINSIRKSN